MTKCQCAIYSIFFTLETLVHWHAVHFLARWEKWLETRLHIYLGQQWNFGFWCWSQMAGGLKLIQGSHIWKTFGCEQFGVRFWNFETSKKMGKQNDQKMSFRSFFLELVEPRQHGSATWTERSEEGSGTTMKTAVSPTLVGDILRDKGTLKLVYEH